MKFEELETRMRVFETAHDHCVLPGLYMVLRLDGKGFTRLTKETQPFEVPFDLKFHELMLDTAAHLMESGFDAAYGYTQSDEISLLLRQDDATFGRKVRKLTTVAAGEASAKFSLGLGSVACFDARISQLPSPAHVMDYFRWRHEDAHRNALNAHCYWMLRKQGASARNAGERLRGLSIAQKNELLFQQGISFNELPAWQKRGSGLYWETFLKTATNALTGAEVQTERRRLKRDHALPLGEAYADFVGSLIY